MNLSITGIFILDLSSLIVLIIRCFQNINSQSIKARFFCMIRHNKLRKIGETPKQRGHQSGCLLKQKSPNKRYSQYFLLIELAVWQGIASREAGILRFVLCLHAYVAHCIAGLADHIVSFSAAQQRR